MIKSPCKDCKKRTIPKTCEKTCENWINYKKNYEEQKETCRKRKELHYKLWRTHENH